MVDTQQTELRDELIAYLKRTVGEEFVRLIDEPEGVQIGERVLYKLKGVKEAERHELSKPEIEEMREEMVELAKSTGVAESDVEFQAPVSSGLPYPRLIDLPGTAIIWDTDLRKYMESDDVLPSPDFPLEWVVGILLMSSETMLVHLDFTHPKVKAIFRVIRDDESGSPTYANILDSFKQFWGKESELKVQSEDKPDIEWVKIVQMDMDPLCIKITQKEREGIGR